MGFEINIGSRQNQNTLTVGGVILGAIAIAIFAAEFFLLKGDLVANGSISFSGNTEPMSIEMNELPGKLLVEIRSGSKKHPVELEIELLDPNGQVVFKKDEAFKHHGARYFTFTPTIEGVYKLHVNGEKGLLGVNTGYANINVFANDRRFFWRFSSNKL